MWLNFSATLRSKPDQRSVLIAAYLFVLTLNGCYSENVTTHAIKTIPKVLESVNYLNGN